MFKTDSLNSFPNLSALCQKDEKQRKSLEKLLQHKPNVVRSLDIYAQNIEEYLKDQRKRIAFLKKKEEPNFDPKTIQIYDEGLIQQYNRVRAKQYYLQQSQKRSSQQPSPEQTRKRTPSKYFDKNYTPLKRNEKFDIPSLQPVSISPPKELKPIQFRFNYYLQNNDPILKQVFNNRQQQWFEVPNNQFAHFQWLSQLLDFSQLIKQEIVSKRQMINLMEFHQDWSSKSCFYNILSSISIEFALKILQPGFVLNFKIAQWQEDLEIIQDYFLQNHPQKDQQKKFKFQAYIPAKTGISFNNQMINEIKEFPKFWICKPVQCSGATIIQNLDQLQQFLYQYYKESKEFIIQKYITNPLLFNGKKFDIQINVLVNQDNQIFVSSEPTGRSCLSNFDLNSDDSLIHTKSKQQIQYQDLIDFLNTIGIDKKQLLQLIINIIKQLPQKLNKRQRKYCMQIFGFDFIMDDTKKLNLIGINANPNISYSEFEGAFKHTIDKIFPTNIKNENQLWILI